MRKVKVLMAMREKAVVGLPFWRSASSAEGIAGRVTLEKRVQQISVG